MIEFRKKGKEGDINSSFFPVFAREVVREVEVRAKACLPLWKSYKLQGFPRKDASFLKIKKILSLLIDKEGKIRFFLIF